MADTDRKGPSGEPVTPADAVFMFVAWLTTRSESISVGADNEVPLLLEPMKAWLEGQGFGLPSEHYPNNLIALDDNGKAFPADGDSA